MKKIHPLLPGFPFVSDTKNQLVPKSTKPYLLKFTVMTAKLYLKRSLLLILAVFMCGSTYAQPATGLNFDGIDDNVTINNTLGNFGAGDSRSCVVRSAA